MGYHRFCFLLQLKTLGFSDTVMTKEPSVTLKQRKDIDLPKNPRQATVGIRNISMLFSNKPQTAWEMRNETKYVLGKKTTKNCYAEYKKVFFL